MSRDGKRRRGLTYEDRVLWTTVVQSVTPLRADDRIAAVDDIAPAPTPTPAPKHPPKHPPKIVKPARLSNPTPPPMEPLTRRMKSRVAKGRQPIEAKLDLHGFTQADAHAVLLRFLRKAQERDARLVLVITGKGRGGSIGVLRRQVPQWLGLPDFRPLIVGFEDAAIAHGGEGALYIRVRRVRGD